MRRRLGIGPGARVIGHVGRLAQEKNLTFFAEALRQQLQRDPTSKLLVVGDGAAQPQLREQLAGAAGAGQLILTGRLSGRELIDAYAAMDVFAFASQSETQGIVLAEAMAAGKPVVALDAPGVRDILRGGINGIILPGDASAERFAAALAELLGNPRLRRRCQIGAAATARSYSQERCAQQVLSLYTEVRGRYRQLDDDPNTWERLLAAVEIEWQLLAAKMAVAGAAVAGTAGAEVHLE
jgi:glycosyltransferase involved in cell wall biosynthesis